MGKDEVILKEVIGRNSLTDLKWSSVLSLDSSVRQGLSIMNTMFEHKIVHNFTCYQAILGQIGQKSFDCVIRPAALGYGLW